MDVPLLIAYVIVVCLWLTMVMTIVMCAGNEKKDKTASVQVDDKNAASKSSYVAQEIDPNASASALNLPKLPPKGEEADVPLPSGFQAASQAQSSQAGPFPGKKRGKRGKYVPKAGHTCPIKPVDEDPTMPVEDDMMAMKMAAKNAPATPPPKFPH